MDAAIFEIAAIDPIFQPGIQALDYACAQYAMHHSVEDCTRQTIRICLVLGFGSAQAIHEVLTPDMQGQLGAEESRAFSTKMTAGMADPEIEQSMNAMQRHWKEG